MALTRITKGVIKPNENYDTHNINSTGIVTAIGLDVNGNGDISGNLSVGGVLTYEDVTSIDSVGIITAQKDIHVGGGVSAVGVGTFGSLDIGGDIDVDGHTNLDNVNIAGITTINGGKLAIGNVVPSKMLELYAGGTVASMYESTGANYVEAQFKNSSRHYILGIRPETSHAFCIMDNSSGSGGVLLKARDHTITLDHDLNVDGHTNLDNVSIVGVATVTGNIIATGAVDANGITIGGNTPVLNFNDANDNPDFRFIVNNNSFILEDTTNSQQRFTVGSTGNISIANDLDVDGHTNLDNVSIAGVSTVTTFLQVLGQAGTSDKGFEVRSNSTQNTDTNKAIRIRNNSNTDTFNISYKGKVTATELDISGNIDVDGHTNLDNVSIAGVSTFNGGSTFGSSIDLGGELNFTGNGHKYIDVATLNGSNTLTIRHQDGGSYETAAYFDANGGAYLQFNGNTKFATTNTGAVVTGNVTANHSNGQVLLQASDGAIEITRTAGAAYIDFKNDTSEDYDVRINEEGGNLRVNKHFRLYDNKAIELGNRTSSTYGDLRLYHDTNNSIIENFTGALYIRNYDTNSTDIVLSARNNIALQPSLNETGLQCLANGSTELFYDSGTYGTPKLSTTATGIRVGGEVAATQDYPDTRPSLDLNFAATKKLDSRIKYTRSGRASFINEKGLLEIVNSNVPRFDHDPVTRECKGLLIEAARTNLLTYSNVKGMSSPNLGGSPQVNDTVNNITLPTGEKGDVRRYLAASGGGGGRWGDYSGTNNQSYTGSVWVRTVSGTTSVVIDINDGGGKTLTITEEWQRITTTHSSNNTYRFFDIYFSSPTTIYYWGVQIEEGAFMTSYIPTNNATATRGGDNILIDGQDFLDFYNPVESTILVDYSHFDGVTGTNLGSNARLYRFRATGGSDTRIDYVTNTGYNPYIAKDGSSPANISHGQTHVFNGGVNRVAVRVKQDSFGVSYNGSAVSGNALDTSGAWPPNNAMDHVSIGGMAAHYLNGHVQRFTYYPTGVSNSQLVTLTS